MECPVRIPLPYVHWSLRHATNTAPAVFEFAISLILAIIVMYDAMGVRRETGIQAQVLNDMMKIFEDMGRSEISPHDKLKEFVGHTPLQVLMGALLGIFCGVIIYTFVI